jgi:hypothetical protein
MKKRTIYLAVGVATLYFQNLYGQETVKDSVKSSDIEQVVITGNSKPKAKLESSTAISTLRRKKYKSKIQSVRQHCYKESPDLR